MFCDSPGDFSNRSSLQIGVHSDLWKNPKTTDFKLINQISKIN